MRHDERRALAEAGQIPFEDMSDEDFCHWYRGVGRRADDEFRLLVAEVDLPPGTLRRAIDQMFPTQHEQLPMGELLRHGSLVFGRLPVHMVSAADLREHETAVLEPLRRMREHLAAKGVDAIEVRDWGTAEEVAARWMRANGWPDARLTRSGPDAGVDVVSKTAVAQVKWFAEKRIGRPALQQIRGAAKSRQQVLFFANSEAGQGAPYTQEAVKWSSASRVQLLTISPFGYVASYS